MHEESNLKPMWTAVSMLIPLYILLLMIHSPHVDYPSLLYLQSVKYKIARD